MMNTKVLAMILTTVMGVNTVKTANILTRVGATVVEAAVEVLKQEASHKEEVVKDMEFVDQVEPEEGEPAVEQIEPEVEVVNEVNEPEVIETIEQPVVENEMPYLEPVYIAPEVDYAYTNQTTPVIEDYDIVNEPATVIEDYDIVNEPATVIEDYDIVNEPATVIEDYDTTNEPAVIQ